MLAISGTAFDFQNRFGEDQSVSPTGQVLGVDVGYSQRARSTAFCRLSWDTNQLTWCIARSRLDEDERICALA